MSIFPKMKDMPPEEQAKARHDLLKYCELHLCDGKGVAGTVRGSGMN